MEFTSHSENPRRVAVGMSGGLDSSVVASLLVDQGYEVIGLTLRMFKEGSRCCSLEDILRAQRVCDFLNIRHETVNAIELFEQTIIRPFVEEYARGRTPSPCVLCNEHIKFGVLHERARQLGCHQVATGHYVRAERREDGVHLLRGRDAKKDQSYFLHRLSQEQLARSLFPLESMKKTEVAVYARARHVPVSTSSKAESQDLCFVTNDGHGKLVEKYRPELRQPGEILDTAGHVLGAHGGFHHFTIGQRRGLGVPARTRLYVKEIDAAANRIQLGRKEEVMAQACEVEDIHWIAGHPPAREFRCDARIRYRHQATPVRVRLGANRRMRLEFAEPQFAVTPGQAAVLYRGDEVLGGGWIANPEPVKIVV